MEMGKSIVSYLIPLIIDAVQLAQLKLVSIVPEVNSPLAMKLVVMVNIMESTNAMMVIRKMETVAQETV